MPSHRCCVGSSNWTRAPVFQCSHLGFPRFWRRESKISIPSPFWESGLWRGSSVALLSLPASPVSAPWKLQVKVGACVWGGRVLDCSRVPENVQSGRYGVLEPKSPVRDVPASCRSGPAFVTHCILSLPESSLRDTWPQCAVKQLRPAVNFASSNKRS